MKYGLYIGVMSGTSMDGIDVALVSIEKQYINYENRDQQKQKIVQIGRYSYALPPLLKEELLSLCRGEPITIAKLGYLDASLGALYAEAVLGLLDKYQLTSQQITAIGCHGQTVWHEPAGPLPFSIQLGDNNKIAALTGITTIGDFRRRDMALGGQGAPLVPAFHHAVLFEPMERRIVLNIGGIANITLLLPDQAVKGFDTGPGNILMDAWILQQKGFGYDHNGAWAAEGHVHAALLHTMLQDPYFAHLPPKSTGREHFNLSWLQHHLAAFPLLPTEDIQATLLELTAKSITDQVQLAGGCQRLLVCGGGAHNDLLMQRMAELLPASEVAITDSYGVSGDDMEALAFAWLAARTLSGLSGNLPAVTGAKAATILGAVYPVQQRGSGADATEPND